MQIEAKVRDYPETGTMQEIGAKVGDVVVMGEYHDDKMTVVECPPRVGKYFHNEYELEGTVSGEGIYGGSGKWRIISRASETKPSPVREVTRKEIVVGQYGIVDLAGVDDDMVQVRLQTTRSLKTWFTAAELTAAIATLTEIRDAMVQE